MEPNHSNITPNPLSILSIFLSPFLSLKDEAEGNRRLKKEYGNLLINEMRKSSNG